MWESLTVANGKFSVGKNRLHVNNPSCVKTLFNGFAAFLVVLFDIDKYYLYFHGFRKCKNSHLPLMRIVASTSTLLDVSWGHYISLFLSHLPLIHRKL